MIILANDPGTTESAWSISTPVVLDPRDSRIPLAASAWERPIDSRSMFVLCTGD